MLTLAQLVQLSLGASQESIEENVSTLFVTIPLIWLITILLLSRANYEEHQSKIYEELVALNELAREYLSMRDATAFGNTSLAKIADTFGADGGIILTYDRSKKGFSILASAGEIPIAAEKLGNFMTQMVPSEKAKAGPLQYVDRMREAFAQLKTESASEGFETVLAVPMRASFRGAPGMIILFARKRKKITKADLALLTVTATGTSMWIRQLQSIDRIRQMSELQKGLLEFCLRMRHEIEIAEITEHVVKRLVNLVPSSSATLYLYDSDHDMMYAAYSEGENAEAMTARGLFPLSEAGIIGDILRNGKAEIIPDSHYDRMAVRTTKEDGATILALPLISREKTLGVIELHRDLPAIFTNDELETARLFAQSAALAIENALLMREREQEKDRSKLYLDLLTHDIANLNTPLEAYFEMILRFKETDGEMRQMLEKAHGQVGKMNALLARVRKLSKAQLEEMEELSDYELVGLIKELSSTLKSSFSNKHIDVKIKTYEPACSVQAGEMLDEVIFNVLHNAVKYTSGRDVAIEITLELLEINGKWYCAVRICDHGCGIADDDKERIFHEERVEGASFARGFGIGLSTCRKLMESYGGNIWAEDRVKGERKKGACIVITLPVGAKTAKP